MYKHECLQGGATCAARRQNLAWTGSEELFECTASIQLDRWRRPLGLRWLELQEVVMTFDLELTPESPQLCVAGLFLTSRGNMTLTYDPLTQRKSPTPTNDVTVNVEVQGTSSYYFPHLVLRISSGAALSRGREIRSLNCCVHEHVCMQLHAGCKHRAL